jgi:hypothetical protein
MVGTYSNSHISEIQGCRFGESVASHRGQIWLYFIFMRNAIYKKGAEHFCLAPYILEFYN